ncbi:MAG: hypothetical protein ACK4N5_19450, partial [Myxococcales bacterium]
GMIELLIADIATTERGRADFPFLRNWDAYEAHTWANGIGFVGGISGRVYRVESTGTALQLTIPEGVSGVKLDTTATGDIRNYAMSSPNTMWVAGSAGYSLKSSNGGASFSHFEIDPTITTKAYFSVAALDAQNIFIGGSATYAPAATGVSTSAAPYIVRSADGGATWTRMELPSNQVASSTPINGLDCKGTTCVAVGSYSTTSNPSTLLAFNPTSGKFERQALVGTNGAELGYRTLNDVRLWDATRGFLVGLSGTLASYDAANNRWVMEATAVTTGTTTASMYGVAALDAETAVAVGGSGVIYRRTKDQSGVVSWTKIVPTPTSTATFYAVRFVGNTGYIVGSSGKLYKSTDAGLTWNEITHTLGTATIYALHLYGPDSLLIGRTSRDMFRNNVGGL